ncbi:UNVERIFIED_CONTAM: hypothetical protein K2H54_009859 [Gekko kuhli]
MEIPEQNRGSSSHALPRNLSLHSGHGPVTVSSQSCVHSSPEAQPKYIKGGKRYGRRSLPEFQEPVGDFAKVTVIEPLNEEAPPPCLSNDACDEVRIA